MPKENVQRAIARGTGTLDGVNYEEIRYEGYGINGAAIIVDCLTDNRVRTVSEVATPFRNSAVTWVPKVRFLSVQTLRHAVFRSRYR